MTKTFREKLFENINCKSGINNIYKIKRSLSDPLDYIYTDNKINKQKEENI